MNDALTTDRSLPGPPGRDRHPPRRLTTLVSILGPAAAVGAFAWAPPATVPWGAALLVAGLALATFLAAIPVGLHGEVNLDDVAFVVGLAILPGALVAPCVAAGLLAAQWIRRRPPPKVAFNVGAHLLAGTLAVATVQALGFADASLEGRAVLALVAALVKTLATAALVVGVTSRLHGEEEVRLRAFLATGLAYTMAAAAFGTLVLFASAATPWALPVALAVAGLFLLRFRADAGVRGDHQRRLVEAASELHRAKDLPEALGAVATAVRDLVGARDVRLAPATTPARDGTTIDLPGRIERIELVDLPGDLPVAHEMQELLATLGSLAAATLDRLGTIEKLGRESERDPLTDAFNRRRFERELRQRVAGGEPYVLALVDLDDFKAFNDGRGHPAGDALLRTLVDDLRRTFRDDDGVFRLGGDEFALLLARMPLAVAHERIEAFLREREARARDGGRPRVGLSVGVAAFPQHARDPETIVRLADEALYRAKREGGGSVRGAAAVDRNRS